MLLGVVLAGLGALLGFVVDDGAAGLDLGTIGYTLMGLGGGAFLIGLARELTADAAAGPIPDEAHDGDRPDRGDPPAP